MTRLAAITGGTGFVGSHLVETLYAEGWDLRLLTRREPALTLGVRSIELVPGSLADPDALRVLVTGADVIVHLAGTIKARSRADFMAGNATGTADLVRAWREFAPEARFVLMSSLAAREPELSHYAASKSSAEAHVLAAGGSSVVLRPCAIYGPRDRETLTVFKAAKLPFHPLLNGPEARVCLVHVRDVVSAVQASLAVEMQQGVYEVSDARHEGYSYAEIALAACAAVGSSAHPIRLPASVMRWVGRAGDLVSTLTGSAEMLTSQKVREILHKDWSSPVDRQLPAHSWHPDTDLSQGFSEAVAWYRTKGWL